jgi:trimeric autotransporter adhesin
MAGAGFKTFSAGEVLLASEVNTFLMQQAVMVFGSSAVRATAIPSPSEGMLAYLQDTNNVEKYTGSAWEPIVAGDITDVVAGTALTGGGSSGSVTLNVDLDGYPQAYPQNASGSVADGGTATLNVGTAQYHILELPAGGTATVAFSDIAADGKVHAWQVELVAGTPVPGTVVFPAAVSFSGEYPTITANKKTVLSFLTRNNGTAIYGGSSFTAV